VPDGWMCPTIGKLLCVCQITKQTYDFVCFTDRKDLFAIVPLCHLDVLMVACMLNLLVDGEVRELAILGCERRTMRTCPGVVTPPSTRVRGAA
jgi:hypothetical protein